MADDFAALQAKLQSLRTTELQKIQRKALKEVGKLVKGVMEFSAPIMVESKKGSLTPGEMKASIRARVSVPSDAAVLAGKQARVTIGPTGRKVKFIAHDVEYGHGETDEHPFIRPTADHCEAQATEIFQENLTAGVQKAMKNA